MLWTVIKYLIIIALHIGAGFAVTGNPVSLLIGVFLLFYWMDRLEKAQTIIRQRRAEAQQNSAE